MTLVMNCPLCGKKLGNPFSGCLDCGVYFCRNCGCWRGWSCGSTDGIECDHCKMARTKQEIPRQRDWVRDVVEFRKLCGLPMSAKPTLPNPDKMALHIRVLEEELEELKEAYTEGDLAAASDAHIDIMYYVQGEMLDNGVDPRSVWDAVHEGNMKKKGGPKRADGKHCKPPGWKHPDIAAAIEKGSLDEYGIIEEKT